MKEPSAPNRRDRRVPAWAVAIVLLAVLLALASGCAPKKVVSTGATDQAGSTTGVKKRLTRSEPPPPEARPGSEVPGEVLGDPEDPEDPEEGELPAPDQRPRAGRPGYQATLQSVQLGMQAASLARDQLGKQYQWGATGPDRFDCSGLSYWVFGQLGVQLPRVSRNQARAGRDVGLSELQAGDLVFFSTQGSQINHVGIYLDDGEFVHAPRRYQPVRIDSLDDAWWRRRFRVARRMP